VTASPTERPPPAYVLERITPRSLVRTLMILRTHPPGYEPAAMAERLAIGVQTFRQWETQALDLRLPVQVLQRYQDLLGIPMGVILVISQALSAAREGKEQQLVVLSKMLQAIVERIATTAARAEAVAMVKGRPGIAGWDRLLGHLIERSYSAVTDAEIKAWTLPKRLDHHRKKHEERSREQKARADTRKGRVSSTGSGRKRGVRVTKNTK